MKRTLTLLGIIMTFYPYAQEKWTSGRPDGHAPIGVMGDHTHGKGEVMISYRYMHMDMEEMRDGTGRLTSVQVLQDFNFTVTPERMPMDMHMIGIMYAISDDFTLMGMVNFLSISMDHTSRPGAAFTTESGGFGDIRLSGLYKFFDNNHQRAHFNLGISIPTGSIDERDQTPLPMPAERQLPYPMQIGSGTWDLMPGMTYMNEMGDYSMGAQIMGNLRLNENERDYRLGHKVEATYWSAYRLLGFLSVSGRLRYISLGQIQGRDEELGQINPMNDALMTVPTAFPENFGGDQVFVGGGLNIYIASGVLKNVRIGGEIEFPIYQDLNGPQLETDYNLTIGAQYSF